MNSRKKIALLSPYPVDMKSFSGGVETATAGLLEGLKEYQGEIEFHIISVPSDLTREIHVQHDGFYFHFLSLYKSWMWPHSFYRVARIIRVLNRILPDLVHCQGSIDLALAAMWSGYPRFITIHGIKKHEVGKRIGWESLCAMADGFVEGFVWRHFKYLICVSEYARHIIGNDKCTYLISNAIRSEFFGVHRNSGSHPPRLLFIGSLSPLKRPMDLIEAHNRLRNEFPALETIFCGEPESQRSFNDLRANAGDGVHFAGRLDQTELIRELGQATVLVLPSAQENAPIVIGEAMAAGVPVVATSVGGIPEILRDELAETLYSVGDVNRLTSILRSLLSDPEGRLRLAKIARDEASKRFAAEKIAFETMNVYREVLQQEKTGEER